MPYSTPLPYGDKTLSMIEASCAKEPHVGHMQVNELAWLCGVQHYAFLTLPRSVQRGWISLETATMEIERRNLKSQAPLTVEERRSESQLQRDQLVEIDRQERLEQEYGWRPGEVRKREAELGRKIESGERL